MTGRARRDTPETGLEMERKSRGTPTVCQGPSRVLVNRTAFSSPWRFPEWTGRTWRGAGAGGDGEMLRVSIHCFYSTQCSHLLKYA